MAAKSTPRTRKLPSAQRFTRALLAWYRKAARDLPWRRTRDPYEVIVSEFMLQQTQVSRVLEYYPRFLKRFPTVYQLARATPKAVREQWEGLGYYARASNLHALARVVGNDHDGRVPSTPEELIKLPGVGRYTAGAVASFAYEKPVPAVDTNVARVIARYFLGAGSREPSTPRKRKVRLPRPSGSPLGTPGSREIWDIAAQIVPKSGKRAWEFNQAIMELGARVCVARKPRCPECPVKRRCRAKKLDA